MTTSPETTLIEFLRYDNWMNQQLLAICMDVDKELLSAEIPGTYGSIHIMNPTIHLMEYRRAAQQGWQPTRSAAKTAVRADKC